MGRNRKSARKAGTAMETAVRDYLAWALDDDRIQRLRLHGSKDLGDIGNVYYEGKPICVECKNTVKADTAGQLREAQTEAGNMDALCGVVVRKRKGIGINDREHTGEQLVMMTLHDFALLLNHGVELGGDEPPGNGTGAPVMRLSPAEHEATGKGRIAEE